MIYTPPASNDINFALSSFTPETMSGDDKTLSVYTPPAANAVDFLLSSTVYPTFPSVDFELGGISGVIHYLTLNDSLNITDDLIKNFNIYLNDNLTMTDVLNSVYQRTIAQQKPWFFKDYPHPQAVKWKIDYMI